MRCHIEHRISGTIPNPYFSTHRNSLINILLENVPKGNALRPRPSTRTSPRRLWRATTTQTRSPCSIPLERRWQWSRAISLSIPPIAGRVHHYIFTSFTILIDSGSSSVSPTGYEACGRPKNMSLVHLMLAFCVLYVV